MDDLRIEAVSSRCTVCAGLLADRHRVTTAYLKSDLLYARHELEVGFFIGNVRPFWLHVDCADPKLEKKNVLPLLDYCIVCRQKLRATDIIQPVMQVTAVNVQSRTDPTDTGLAIGDRIHFKHAHCGDRSLDTKTSPILLGG